MKKLYDVKITFDQADFKGEVESVGIQGEFLFYESGLTGHTDETGIVDCEEKFPPSQYREGLFPIGGRYYEEMTKNADGIYELELKLPAGAYPYSFLINADLGEPASDERMAWSNLIDKKGKKLGINNLMDALKCDFKGEKNHVIVDPKNPPVAPTVTGKQMNSVVYVGTKEESARVPIGNPRETGTVSYQSYFDVDGKVQTAGVYLPANYDKNKTYPLVIVSHGGGGNEADWFAQGSLNNVLDNMIAERRTREAIVVTPNNSVYEWDFAKIAKNIEEYLVPYIEKIYNISDEIKDRAFCGLSMGSMTTLYMYYHRSMKYDYFGAFSGGIAPGNEHFDISDPHLKDVTLMIGSAEEDIAYNFRDIGVPPTITALKEAGLPYTPYFVTGSHDWFCWPEMFEYFAEHILWK